MRVLKIAFIVLAPGLLALAAGAGLYHITGNYTGLFTHDILESHTHSALIPFITLLSVALVYIPALCYLVNITNQAKPAPAADLAPAAAMLTTPTPAGLHIGQIFTTPGANCGLRVKAVKDLTLNYSF